MAGIICLGLAESREHPADVEPEPAQA